MEGRGTRDLAGEGASEPASETPSRARKRYLGYLFGAVVAAIAVFLLYRTLSRYDWPELVAAVSAVSGGRISAALGFTALSYLTLTGFDWLALHYVRRPLPYRRVAVASFAALSIGHNVGLAAFSSGAIRYRFYARWGLRASEVAKLIVFCGITVGLGLGILGGGALLVRPDVAVEALGLTRGVAHAAGAACLAVAAGYLVLAATIRRPLCVRGREIRMPNIRLALAQTIIGPLNFAFVAAALHQAVLAIADIPYLSVASAYVSANVATLITHVPGGLGVVESVLLYLLPGEKLIGAVLVFRVAYFLVPLVLGISVLAGYELVLLRRSKQPTA